MEHLDVFSSLNLDAVTNDWVNLIWMENFISFVEPSETYKSYLEKEDVNSFLKEICYVTRKWVKNIKEDAECESARRIIKENKVNSKKLLAVLGYIIQSGQQVTADEDTRQSCLRATTLYLTLLSIPGSSIHEIFHPNLFQLAINTFKLLEHLIPVYQKPNKNVDLADLYNEEMCPKTTLTQQEKQTLTHGLNSIMYDTINTLENFNLRDHERSLEVLVNCLVEIAKAETNVNPLTINIKMSKASLASLSYNAYIALKDLCNPRHGPVDVTIRLILRYIFQHFLMNHIELPPKNLNTLKETVLKFLKILLDTHEKDSTLGFKILMQQLIVNSPERVEARQKQATIVAKIVNMFHGPLFYSFMESIVLYSHSNKISLRIFALEVTNKLLCEIMNQDNLCEDDLTFRIQAKKILLAIVLAKCKDISNMARGKAMAIITDVIDKNHKETFKEEFGIMFDKNNNHQLPCLNQLQSAMKDGTNPLPGLNAILQMLFLRVEDDRALVRRSTLQTLKNVNYFQPDAIDQVIPLIGKHCRDSSMAVRKFAIQILTQMLQETPENNILMEEWVKCVIPQIYDVESKVQEKVLEMMDQVILGELKMWNGDDSNDSAELPWRIIDKLVQLEMRKFLAKACNLWVKNGRIDNSYVTRVRTHIDTVHEVQAWVLLAMFSENFVLSNMDIYFNNYIEIIKSTKYHIKFILEVLRNCLSKIDKTLLQRMQGQIYQSLCQFEVPFECISICIDILGRIYKQLQSNGERDFEANMFTLMKSSEAKVNKIFNEEDSTDICPLRAMSTLGKSAFVCTGKVMPSTLTILQGMLLDWDSVPTSLQEFTILKQFGIQLLGELGLRDRDVAEQVTPILSCLMCQASNDQSISETTIRVNAAKILADLCERFTALVEPFLPEMCICMKDPNPRVREAIVIIFIQLLLEDFIKVKGLFFFHILTMISDPDETIKELTICLVKERLIVKNKALIYHQFIRCIFHYNDCTLHQKVGELKMTDKEKSVLLLSGIQNEAKRRSVYEFMLEHIDPLGKLKLIESLTQKVLHGFLDDTLKINGDNEMCLLKDTIYILSCDYIQPNFNANKQHDDELQEESTTTANVHNNVLNCLMESTKSFKIKHLMPTLVKLSSKLKNSKLPVLSDINRFFIQLVLEYSKEQFLALINEYPELEDKIENIRKNGKKQLNEHASDDEENKDNSCESLKKKHKLNKTFVVLSRLSEDQIAHARKKKLDTPDELEIPDHNMETNQQMSKKMPTNLTDSPISEKCKLSRSRSSSISSIITSSVYSSTGRISSSTPIPFKNQKSDCDLDYNLFCKNIQNQIPEITDDESDTEVHLKLQ